MREYDFGDVFDCRNVPGVEHFIIILGFREVDGKKYIFYEKVTSRVYKAFGKLSNFFENHCNGRCKKFQHNFKETKAVNHYGKLCYTLFLDKDENYLDEDSMIVIKGEPEKAELEVLEKWVKEGLARPKVRIANVDIYKLIAIINHSDNISKVISDRIRTSFNKVDKEIKKQIRQKELKKKEK